MARSRQSKWVLMVAVCLARVRIRYRVYPCVWMCVRALVVQMGEVNCIQQAHSACLGVCTHAAQAIEADGMLDNATQRGAQLMKGLVKLAEK